MEYQNPQTALAHLESKVDVLESELSYLNDLLIRCGFPEGVDSLKKVVEELLEKNPSDEL